MSGIIYGLYEQIINGIINENLNKVDQKLVVKETQLLDSAESSKIPADYLTRILRNPARDFEGRVTAEISLFYFIWTHKQE